MTVIDRDTDGRIAGAEARRDGGGGEGLVIERRTADTPWEVIVDTDAPQQAPFIDDVGAARQRFSYRVATRSAGNGQETVDAIRSAGGDAMLVQCDIGQHAVVDDVVATPIQARITATSGTSPCPSNSLICSLK